MSTENNSENLQTNCSSQVSANDLQYNQSLVEQQRRQQMKEQERLRQQQAYEAEQQAAIQAENERRRRNTEEYTRLVAEENELKRVRYAEIVFIPHFILNGYPIDVVGTYLLKGYKIYYQYNQDGSFVVTNSFDNLVDERECFIFVFACKGRLYWSDNHREFDGTMNQNYQNDKNISASLPEYVYVINGRRFNFDGSLY